MKKTNLPRIYFLIEVKKREFDSRVYFATKAALQGFSVVFGKKSVIFDNRKYLQKGLIIFKSIGPNNIYQIKEYKKLGYTIGAIDEEGMNYLSDEYYLQSRHTKNISLIDIFFCWGKKEYNTIINAYPEFKDKVYITGNQRIDVLKNEFKKKYVKRSEIIKQKYGDFILLNTMFTIANQKMKQSKENSKLSIFDKLIKKGWSAESDYMKIFKKYVDFQHENMKMTIEFIKEFPINFPNKKLIIRPHPNEIVELWLEVAKNLKNVIVVFDDESTCAWIEASKFVISSNCTTSVESFMLNKKPINLISDFATECRFAVPQLVSNNITNLKDLNEIVKNFHPIYNKNEIYEINDKLKEFIFNCSENNCSAYNILTAYKKKFKTNQVLKKDRFENIFYYYFFSFYYIVRFYYRKLFTKQNKTLIELITQKLKRLDSHEIRQTAKDYLNGLKVDEKTIKIKEIYPQVFKIEKK